MTQLYLEVHDVDAGRTSKVFLTENADGSFSLPATVTPGTSDGKAAGAAASASLTATLSAWNPASLAAGAAVTSADIDLAGAAFGDFVEVAASASLQGLVASASVKAADTVVITLVNGTVGAVDLAATDFTVRIRK